MRMMMIMPGSRRGSRWRCRRRKISLRSQTSRRRRSIDVIFVWFGQIFKGRQFSPKVDQLFLSLKVIFFQFSRIIQGFLFIIIIVIQFCWVICMNPQSSSFFLLLLLNKIIPDILLWFTVKLLFVVMRHLVVKMMMMMMMMVIGSIHVRRRRVTRLSFIARQICLSSHSFLTRLWLTSMRSWWWFSSIHSDWTSCLWADHCVFFWFIDFFSFCPFLSWVFLTVN